jgi:hypothetical protein
MFCGWEPFGGRLSGSQSVQQMVDQLVDAGQGGAGQEGEVLGVARNGLAALLGVGDDPEEGFLRAGDGGGQLLGGVRVVFAGVHQLPQGGFSTGRRGGLRGGTSG